MSKIMLRMAAMERVMMGQNPLPISPKRLIPCNGKELRSMKMKKTRITMFATISPLFIKASFIKKVKSAERKVISALFHLTY
jgi:hypothetical protein